MTTSLLLFETLLTKVQHLCALGESHQGANPSGPSDSIYRACVVLSVAAFDTYMHEKTVSILADALKNSPSATPPIESYLGAKSGQLASVDVPSLVRYHLSFKTLTTPSAIDNAISASGQDPLQIWKSIALMMNSRESRIRNTLELLCDRRNQIAHEGDWDPGQLTLRRISSSHVHDCIDGVTTVVKGIEACWS